MMAFAVRALRSYSLGLRCTFVRALYLKPGSRKGFVQNEMFGFRLEAQSLWEDGFRVSGFK
eukprot:4115661-Amphidinium_carterae.1